MLWRVTNANKDAVSLPRGAALRQLEMHSDERGVLTEMYRVGWAQGFDPVQWNVVSSNAGVLRGVHVHATHSDYLIIIKGPASLRFVSLVGGNRGDDGRTNRGALNPPWCGPWVLLS